MTSAGWLFITRHKQVHTQSAAAIAGLAFVAHAHAAYTTQQTNILKTCNTAKLSRHDEGTPNTKGSVFQLSTQVMLKPQCPGHSCSQVAFSTHWQSWAAPLAHLGAQTGTSVIRCRCSPPPTCQQTLAHHPRRLLCPRPAGSQLPCRPPLTHHPEPGVCLCCSLPAKTHSTGRPTQPQGTQINELTCTMSSHNATVGMRSAQPLA